jgi:hypothetical protein
MAFLFQRFISMILATYLMPFYNILHWNAYTYIYMKMGHMKYNCPQVTFNSNLTTFLVRPIYIKLLAFH